jgi:hypothetical protein
VPLDQPIGQTSILVCKLDKFFSALLVSLAFSRLPHLLFKGAVVLGSRKIVAHRWLIAPRIVQTD